MRSSWGTKKGSRGNPPCGVKGRSSLVGGGATPQLFFGRSTPRKPPNKGAGSEASLPVTLRIRRCAPSCSTSYLHIVAPNGRGHAADLADIAALSRKQEISLLRRRPKGNENRRSLRSPFGNLRSAHPCFLIFIVAGGTAPAGATRGLCGRLLDPFGADTPMQLFACLLENAFGFPYFLTSIGTFSVHAAAFPPKPPNSPSNFPFPGIFLPLRSFHTQGAHFQPSSTSEKRSITPCSTFGKSF